MGPHGKKTARGNIFFFTERDAGQEKCGILYKHCFSILYGFFFGRKRINRKKKREMVPVWALFFLLGKKKSRNQLTRIFFFLVSAMLLQVTLRRPSVSWWKLLQCTGFRWKPSLHLRLVYSFSSDYHILIGAKKF
ncbi:AIC_G0024360.mRNA.1.CDS.1 [Saccharomyces cerevisiae]|nr:AIC_G0024360.mRNA.1.CDS.1 [Saccharomyces cerevisiae]CAI4545354.1 AFI_G0026180.mRNA.1.CDS.1 [Saccharomyces cerevisiae]CAI6711766.1 AIC_G0024360.mRNA.1.CDS.1 [Saccharomyces cerevisiae]CAI6731476.1 AFI_G0026180.mRNA.1.CDS.1 [Saccharomyces cerevisiae]